MHLLFLICRSTYGKPPQLKDGEMTPNNPSSSQDKVSSDYQNASGDNLPTLESRQSREVEPGFRTQMVLLQKNQKDEDGNKVTSKKDGALLLEIRSNCEWDEVRGKVLSLVSSLSSCSDYPKVCTFPVGSFHIEILPKSAHMTEIPKHLRPTLKIQYLHAIRVRITSAKSRTKFMPATVQPTGMSGLKKLKLSLPGLPKASSESAKSPIQTEQISSDSKHLALSCSFGPFVSSKIPNVNNNTSVGEPAKNNLDGEKIKIQILSSAKSGTAIGAKKTICDENSNALTHLADTKITSTATKSSTAKPVSASGSKSTQSAASNKLSLSTLTTNNDHLDLKCNESSAVVEVMEYELKKDDNPVSSSPSMAQTIEKEMNVPVSCDSARSDTLATEASNKIPVIDNRSLTFINTVQAPVILQVSSASCSISSLVVTSTVGSPSTSTSKSGTLATEPSNKIPVIVNTVQAPVILQVSSASHSISPLVITSTISVPSTSTSKSDTLATEPSNKIPVTDKRSLTSVNTVQAPVILQVSSASHSVSPLVISSTVGCPSTSTAKNDTLANEASSKILIIDKRSLTSVNTVQTPVILQISSTSHSINPLVITSTIGAPSTSTATLTTCTGVSASALLTATAASSGAEGKTPPILVYPQAPGSGPRKILIPVSSLSGPAGSNRFCVVNASGISSASLLPSMSVSQCSTSSSIANSICFLAPSNIRPSLATIGSSNGSSLRVLLPIARSTATAGTGEVRRFITTSGVVPILPAPPKFMPMVRAPFMTNLVMAKSLAGEPNKAVTCPPSKDGEVPSNPVSDVNKLQSAPKPVSDVSRLQPAPVLYTRTPLKLSITPNPMTLNKRRTGSGIIEIGDSDEVSYQYQYAN